MIAFVKGKFADIDPTRVVVEAHGVGYEVKISLNTFGAIKAMPEGLLHTYLHVKEDAQTLYGFLDADEKKVFQHLISISGVGPGTAMMVLSSLSAAEVQSAIVNGDVKTIQGVKGIGAKTAQRLILELKDKMVKEDLLQRSDTIPLPAHNTTKSEALQALVTLGIPKNAAQKSIDKVLHAHDQNISLEELIKLALKSA